MPGAARGRQPVVFTRQIANLLYLPFLHTVACAH